MFMIFASSLPISPLCERYETTIGMAKKKLPCIKMCSSLTLLFLAAECHFKLSIISLVFLFALQLPRWNLILWIFLFLVLNNSCTPPFSDCIDFELSIAGWVFFFYFSISHYYFNCCFYLNHAIIFYCLFLKYTSAFLSP